MLQVTKANVNYCVFKGTTKTQAKFNSSNSLAQF
jgi:hypothetical protein